MRAEHRILGYIGEDNRFFLLCPVFHYADGPDIELGGISGFALTDKIKVTYTWREERVEPDEADRDIDAPPLDFIQAFLRRDSQNRETVPASLLTLTVPLPAPFRAMALVSGPLTRTPTTRWAVFEFTTDHTPPREVYNTTCPRQPKRLRSSPSRVDKQLSNK